MPQLLRSRPRAALLGTVVAVLAAAVLTAPGADAHPDPLEGTHKRQASGGIVVRVVSGDLAGEYEAVQWGDTGPLPTEQAELVYAGSGCSPASYLPVAEEIRGNVALIEQTTEADPCPVATFAQKVQSAEQAGAIGLVAIPAEGKEPRGNATAITATIPALEVERLPFLPVRDAVLGGVATEVVLDDTRQELAEVRGGAPCVEGADGGMAAGTFTCEGIDLLSFIPKGTFGEGDISDIWGWTDVAHDDEYVMFGKTDGVGFMRVTDPMNPVYLGALPNPAVRQEIWHDIKVYEDHAFIVSESTPHGMTIFDLTRLRGLGEDGAPQEFDADATYPFNVSAHNIAINEESGYAYIVGGSAALVVPDQCLSGLHMVDIREPKAPTFAGCYAVDGGPGTAARTAGLPEGAAYIHDTQCVMYTGPDEDHRGKEVCFNAAEDQVTIADVSDKSDPVTIGTTDYEGIAYAHQGWLTEDQRYLLTNDELDEMEGGTNTRTVVLDVSDLDNPVVHAIHTHETASIDHNNYVKDGLTYQSNYTSGLQVLDVAPLDHKKKPRLERVAFFDTYPYSDEATFDGTWSNYPYFDSGTVAVSTIGEGIFLLRLQDHVVSELDADGSGGPPDHAVRRGRGPQG